MSTTDATAAGRAPRDPQNTLAGCERILILGRTGSGKTTLARELAAALGVPHVELDALYFGPDLSRAPLDVLRERTSAAIAGESWVTDGNKRAVRDLVWPRADTIVWLDYPVWVSLRRLARRARSRTASLRTEAKRTGGRAGPASVTRASHCRVARGERSRATARCRFSGRANSRGYSRRWPRCDRSAVRTPRAAARSCRRSPARPPVRCASVRSDAVRDRARRARRRRLTHTG